MKRLLFVILLVSQSFTLIAQSERVISFHSDIIIDTSSTISVTESIKIYSNGTVFKRGITRTIPTIGIDSTGNRVKHDLQIVSVEKDGRPSKYGKPASRMRNSKRTSACDVTPFMFTLCALVWKRTSEQKVATRPQNIQTTTTTTTTTATREK